MAFEQVDSLLTENKRLQRKMIKGMAKTKHQLATVLDLISLTNHQEELERKHSEEIEALRISIRKQIQEKGNKLYTSLPAPLRYLVGELMVGNEELVLNQTVAGAGKTLATETILNTGFTINQADFISQAHAQLNSISASLEDANNNLKSILDNSKNLETKTSDILTIQKARNIQTSKLQTQNEMYENKIKDFCSSCPRPRCVNTCPLYVFCGWSKLK